MAPSSQTDFSSRAFEWSVVLVLTGCLISAVVSPQFIAPLVMLFALAVTAAGFRMPSVSAAYSAPVVAAALLLCWAVASILWSVDPELSVKRSFRLFLMIAMGTMVAVFLPRWCLSDRARKFIVLATFLTLAAVIGDTLMGSPMGRMLMDGGDPLDRAATVLVILIWPVGLLAYRQFGLTGLGVLAVATALAVGLLNNKAAMLAALLGCAAAAAAALKPRLGTMMTSAAVLVFAVLVPLSIGSFKTEIQNFVADTSIEASLRHRMHIWSFSAERALEKPLTGWGMGGSRAVPGGNEIRTYLRSDGQSGGQGEALPLHPHNGFLQIFLELGLVGTALAAAAVFLILRKLSLAAERSGLAPPVAGFVLSALVVGSISFGAWQGWWVSLQLFAGALLFVLTREKSD